MFLIRLGVVALVVLLFLPGPPRAHIPGKAGGDGFCDRYPKTCDASVEIGDALKHKLIYAMGWLSNKAGVHVPGLAAQSAPADGYRTDRPYYDDSSRSRPTQRFDERYDYDRGTLHETDRRRYWPETSRRPDVYPGR